MAGPPERLSQQQKGLAIPGFLLLCANILSCRADEVFTRAGHDLSKGGEDLSWHHGDYIDLISATGTLAAAIIAAYAASQSNKSARESRLLQEESRVHQKELHAFEREKHLYELLRADAERANDNARQGYPSELSFSQASNIALSLNSARSRIIEFANKNDDESLSKYIGYFRHQLAEEVSSYMCVAIPDAINQEDPTVEQIDASSLWIVNRQFFKFRYCEDEDLSDDDEQ